MASWRLGGGGESSVKLGRGATTIIGGGVLNSDDCIPVTFELCGTGVVHVGLLEEEPGRMSALFRGRGGGGSETGVESERRASDGRLTLRCVRNPREICELAWDEWDSESSSLTRSRSEPRSLEMALGPGRRRDERAGLGGEAGNLWGADLGVPGDAVLGPELRGESGAGCRGAGATRVGLRGAQGGSGQAEGSGGGDSGMPFLMSWIEWERARAVWMR